MTPSVVPPPGSRPLADLFPKQVRDSIGDEEKLTQFGFMGNGGSIFRSAPPTKAAPEMSLIRGRKSPTEAARLVGHLGQPKWMRARYTQARVLRAAGFVVEHDPTPTNTDHVRVAIVDKEWTPEVARRFNSCFGH